MVPLLLGVSLAFTLAAVALTAARYRELPDRVPLHFGLTGAANFFGPRPCIWLGPGLQLLFVLLAIAIDVSSHDRGAPLIIGAGLSGAFLWAQVQILDVALPRSNTLPLSRYVTGLVGIFAATLVALFLLRQ